MFRRLALCGLAAGSLFLAHDRWNKHRSPRSSLLSLNESTKSWPLLERAFVTPAEAASKPPVPEEPPARREVMISRLASSNNEPYDLIVVGGGATGCGIAVDAASRGLKVALLEKEDFASGTSSKSTKLIHGGVRYLEKAFWHLDREQYNLVTEALEERAIFLRNAPHLTKPLPIMIPVYRYWQIPYYWAGVKMYDLVAAISGGRLESSYLLTKSKALKEFPMLRSEGLKAAFVYYDGQQNDSRTNIALALTAAQLGASVANYVTVTSLVKDDRGQICGVEAIDRETNQSFVVPAKGVVNATGAFVDALRKMDDPEAKSLIVPSSGAHIILPPYYSPTTMGLLDPQTSDGRMIFMLPWEGHTITGTTDTPVELTDRPRPLEVEIQWILRELERYLSPALHVERGDVLSAWSGLRPLVRDPSAKSEGTEALVRSHLIEVSKAKLITIAGGKWTTYRKMAEETVDRAVKELDLHPKIPHCITRNLPLFGARDYPGEAPIAVSLVQGRGLGIEEAVHLARDYGTQATAVAALARKTKRRWPVRGNRLSPLAPIIEAEVRYAVRVEWARTPMDVLARRTRLAALRVDEALDSLDRVVAIMAEELHWSPERAEREKAASLDWMRETLGADISLSAPLRRSLDLEEKIEYYRLFSSLDRDRDGRIPISEISGMLQEAGSMISPSVLENDDEAVDFEGFVTLLRSDRVQLDGVGADNIDEEREEASLELVRHWNRRRPMAPERSGGGL